MPITVVSPPVSGFVEQAGITAGNEYVFRIPAGQRVLITAEGNNSSATANLAFQLQDQASVTDLTGFDLQFQIDQTQRFNVESRPGVTNVALKISAGTWRMRIKTLV